MGIQIPTKIRVMNLREYAVVTKVFGNTLPYRQRIWMTNGLGLNDRPFTIPTSLISTVLATAVAGPLGLLGGYATSSVNLGYMINIGSKYTSIVDNDPGLLVHETTHVWQGKNSVNSLDYVFNSCLNQCLGNAYDYKSKIGNAWHTFNVEQQAQIVEDWYGSGEPTSGDLWDYIENHLRKGDA